MPASSLTVSESNLPDGQSTGARPGKTLGVIAIVLIVSSMLGVALIIFAVRVTVFLAHEKQKNIDGEEVIKRATSGDYLENVQKNVADDDNTVDAMDDIDTESCLSEIEAGIESQFV